MPTPPPPQAAADELSKIPPDTVMALFKVQAIYRQREADKDKPKAELRVAGLTREQAQRIADDLCQHLYWGSEHIAPAINA
jgi:hypothetical protein